MFRDLILAVRSLRKAPAFAIVTIVTLALGIGANSAIFSVVNGVLLRPLPYPDSDRLVLVRNQLSTTDDGAVGVSGPATLEYNEQADLFEGFSTAAAAGTNLVGDGHPVQITLSWVMWNFFDVLAQPAFLGRTFGIEDVRQFNREDLINPDFTPPPASAVLSYGTWQNQYGGNTSILGETIRLNGQSMVVVGVMPQDFEILLPAYSEMPANIDVWTLMPIDASRMPRTSHQFTVLGRMRPDVSIEAAQTQMDGIAQWQRDNFEHEGSTELRILISPLHEEVVGNVRPALLVLLGAVGLVLLVACSNVASLMLTRSASRDRETAIRTALGSGTFRIFRQQLAEILVLAAAGGIAGLGLATLGIRLLMSLKPEGLPRLDSVALDVNAMLFTVGASFLAAIIAGSLPAVRSMRPGMAGSLRDRSGGRSQKALNGLVIAEVSFSMVLLVAAGLLLKTFSALQAVDTGLVSANVLTGRVSLPFFSYLDREKRGRVFDEIKTGLEALPGVRVVGGIGSLPLSSDGISLSSFAKDRGDESEWTRNKADFRRVLPGYFESLGINLRRGRFFSEIDNRANTAPVIIVDETMAAETWPGEDPIGRNLWVTRIDSTYTGVEIVAAEVIGVVGTVRHAGLDGPPNPAIYFPYRMWYTEEISLTVQTAGSPLELISSLRDVVTSIDGELPVFDIKPMEDYEDRALSRSRFLLTTIAAFAITALILASVGLYGVIAYMVKNRTREIGVRMAFGAQRSMILRMVVRKGVVLAGSGIVFGVFLTLLLGEAIESLVFGIKANDPFTIVVLSMGMLLAAILASAVPARQATRIDPLEAIREE